MSLRVNLITHEEQRSGSRINARTFIRLGKVIIPIIIVFIIGTQTIKYIETTSKLRILESSWVIAEPKQNNSHALLTQLHYNMRTAEELNAWKESRIEWHKQLQAIIEKTPDSIQLTTLFIAPAIGTESTDSPPVRNFTLTIDGKNSGVGAMDYIEKYERHLEAHFSSTGIVESIDVSNYEADTSDNASEFDRIFQIEYIYKSRPEVPLK